MKVITGGDRSSTYGGLFTGQVDLEMLNETAGEEEPDTAFVHFKEGAVTNWHQHPGAVGPWSRPWFCHSDQYGPTADPPDY